MDRKTPPAIPVRSAILEFGAKFNDLCEVLVAIFVLSILPRNLNIVELSMLEFSKIMTEKVQRLKSGPRVQITLISIAPALESTNIFRESKLALEKFIFVLFPSLTRQISDHAMEVCIGPGRKRAVIIYGVHTKSIMLEREDYLGRWRTFYTAYFTCIASCKSIQIRR